MIDLHVHSTFSDGSLTPVQLADEAARIGLTSIALTDHDCTNGVDLFLAACRERGVRGMSGVEVSIDVSGGTMHMLGYCFDPHEPELQAMLVKIREGRESRNQEILGKLSALGLELNYAEVAAFAGEDVVGRPHFAQAMMARGFVKDKDEAFRKYLAKGNPAYTERLRMTAEEAVRLIRQAGGVAVLAHPSTLKLHKNKLRERLTELKALGLQGMEVYYSEHNNEVTRDYSRLADELGLIATGGSDFHGQLNPNIKLGFGFGELRVADEIADRIIAASRP